MKSYEELLTQAEKELPEKAAAAERFELEKITGHLEGNKTIISNLKRIADKCGRPPEHLLKYLLRELATPGKVDGDRVIFGTKIPAELINKKIRQYASEFVLCVQCNKPDTQLTIIEKIPYLKCMACGAKRPVKSVI